MSALGAAFANAIGTLGGPVTAGALVAGGLVAGMVGGGIVAGSGGSQQATSSGTLAVYACPESGSPLVLVQAGQKLLATGRTEDAAWLRIHFPEPGRTEAWVEAAPLQVQGAIADLPVAACAPEIAAAAASVEPLESLTAVANNPSPTEAPVAIPTPAPTDEPNDRPTITALTASTRKISYDTDRYCPKATTSVTFRVRAKDDAGITSVSLYWREPGAGSFTRATMSRTAGSARDGTWQVTLDTAENRITDAGNLAYYALATDGDGATRRIPGRGSDSIDVAVCENTGPTIKEAKSSSGSSLSWDPLGAGDCKTATNITASVKDVDGLRSVTLSYRRPGASGWSSKPMDDDTIKGKWYANLDTLGDKITIPDPPTGSLRWYIKATDDKGKSSQIDTRTLTIRRCDTEAQFDGVFPRNETYPCDTTARITIGTYANDRDQPNDGLSVVFHWSLENRRTGAGPISGKMAANTSKGNYYQGVTKTFDGDRFYSGHVTVWAVTTDRYGGSTTTPKQTYLLGCTSP